MSEQPLITGIDPYSGKGIAVSMADGKIASISPCDSPDQGYLSAGFVDLQVNGYGGIDLNAPDIAPEDVVKLCQRMLAEGVTSFLPTLITAAEPALRSAMKTIVAATGLSQLAQEMIAGLHVEGPAISAVDGARGAHPIDQVRPPSLNEFSRWQQAAGGLIKLVTLAPEQPGAAKFITTLADKGVRCAIGHTNASPGEIQAAVEAGATLATHLGNGAARKLPRHPNHIWSQLGEDKLFASFIADGHHLPAEVLRSMLRAKGLNRSILISDSVSLAGIPAGNYKQAIGGDVIVDDTGKISMVGTDFLAGASLPLSASICKAMDMAGLKLTEALPLVTENPGHFIDKKCQLAEGADADVVRFQVPDRMASGKLEILEVVLAGNSMKELPG